MSEDLSIAVIGGGRFGQNHLRVYRRLRDDGFPVRIAAIVEPDPGQAGRLREEWQVPVLSSTAECLARRADGRLSLEAASVTAPTVAHCKIARACLEAGVDVLVEKPIARTLEEADELVLLARQTGRILQVGHIERFNPGVAAARRLLTTPMFFEAHRLSVFAPRSLDIDVVLDLMIHDLDVVLDFVRSPAAEVHAVGLPVLSREVDIANVRVEFESGAVANFTASRVSTEKVRKLRFFQPGQYVSIDYARQDLLVIGVDSAATVSPSGTPDHPGLSFEKPAVEVGEPLSLEIESFLECVRCRRSPLVTASAGRDVLALALEINHKIAEHARRTGLPV